MVDPSGNFDKVLPITLKFEGGYSNVPGDKGGPTNKGVTQKTYDTYRTDKGLPTQDVKLISDAEIGDIYYNEYWLRADCDKFQWPVNVAVFDLAVNAGPKQSIIILQRAEGLTEDGQVGPQTIGLASSVGLVKLMLYRAWFYVDICRKDLSQTKFLFGWLWRTKQLFSLVK